MLKFIEEGHRYESVDPNDGVKWLSVTTLIGNLHEPFSKDTVEKCAVKKPTPTRPNKWYGLSVEEIQGAWDAERNRSAELGSWYHKTREDALYEMSSSIMVHKQKVEAGVKYAPDQVLYDGIYPEHFIYLRSEGICGQADYVEVTNSSIYIRDYKTSKKIDRKSFVNWEGISKMMTGPVKHLEDCHFYHYALQLSLYMYMMLRHNPNLQPGAMFIEHIKFEIESEDKYDYPIYKKDEAGNFIVKGIEEIEVPYLKKEVYAIVNWLKSNKEKLVK